MKERKKNNTALDSHTSKKSNKEGEETDRGYRVRQIRDEERRKYLSPRKDLSYPCGSGGLDSRRRRSPGWQQAFCIVFLLANLF